MRNFNLFKRLKMKKKNVIRKKLVLYFIISTVLVNSISVYTYSNTRKMTKELNTLFYNDIRLTNLCQSLDSVETSLRSYLTTSHSVDLKNYLGSSNNLKNMAANLDTTLSGDEQDILYTDIKNMTFTYLQDTDFAVQEKRGRDISGYTDEFTEATQIYDYTNEYIDKLKIYEFKENNTNYLQLSGKLSSLQIFNIVIIIIAMIVNFILIILFSYRITEPIIRLSNAAGEIARGNLDIPQVKVNTNDEVKTLADTFNHMTQSIKRQLVEIREKALIESRLKQQEMQNLEMKSALNEAELRSLQSQINPHFMFNTLNAVVQLAMFEGADRTQLFLENFSELLRYNLCNMSTPSDIAGEISNIESYIYLLNERYGDKIEFTKDADESALAEKIPRMTLQPIVENSFIHGISEMESGGHIGICVTKSGNTVLVEVSDNGCGMKGETIDKIINGEKIPGRDEIGKTGHSIGLRNVVKRLKLFYNAEKESDVIEISSKIGKGTKVILKLPAEKRSETDV